jgi:hypothetical protein
MNEALHGWSEFNVAMVGATAALAGLVIVAASVNIAKIIKAASLTARLASAITGLLTALISSAVGLMPGTDQVWYGATVIVVAAIAGSFSVQAARRLFENQNPANGLRGPRSAVLFLTPIAYAVGGVLLLSGAVTSGLVWLAVGSIIAIVVALIVSWVVLVEVLR